MKNMFSENTEKEIPQNLKACYKIDNVATELWSWAENLEKWGIILFWIILIGGLIFSIFSSIVEKEVITSAANAWRDAETELRKTFDFEIFIPLLFETAIYAFLEYLAYHIIAILIGAFASIVQNTKITANVALYKAWLSLEECESNEAVTANTDIDKTSSFGNWTKSNNGTYTNKLDTTPNVSEKNVWICDKCGQKNSTARTTCLKCGFDTGKTTNNNYKTCNYCKRQVPIEQERCECGCINFSS